jgi:hypothetical protein
MSTIASAELHSGPQTMAGITSQKSCVNKKAKFFLCLKTDLEVLLE